MAFQRAVVEIKPASVGTGIKVSLKKMRAASAKMTIVISSAVAKQLDWRGGDKIDVLIGDGDDHGMVRLRKNNSVGQAVLSERRAMKGATYFCLGLGHQPAFVDESHQAAWCQWEKIEDGYVELVLPKWADATAKRPKVAAAPAAAQPVARKVASVTGKLMGDPEPGRREALAKMGK